MVLDESHVTVPQIHGQYAGDRSRKDVLVDHGFRLPSAMDNRPLTFEEWYERVDQVVLLSATPAKWEMEQSSQVVEQIIRPTGLVDPEIVVRPTKGQIDDLVDEMQKRAEGDQRVLVTTLTKKMAEDLRTTCSRWVSALATSIPTSTPWSGSRSCAICGWGSTTS